MKTDLNKAFADFVGIIETQKDLGAEILQEVSTGFFATAFSKSFALVSDLWNYNLVDLIPKEGEKYHVHTLVSTILTYGAVLRISLIILIYISPFSEIRRSLMRLQYRVFGV